MDLAVTAYSASLPPADDVRGVLESQPASDRWVWFPQAYLLPIKSPAACQVVSAIGGVLIWTHAGRLANHCTSNDDTTQPSQRCKVAFVALILNMPDPDFEDHMLAGQGMIEVKGHGIFVDGMDLKRNERPTGAGQFTRVAYT
jgi:hypothetical protein